MIAKIKALREGLEELQEQLTNDYTNQSNITYYNDYVSRFDDVSFLIDELDKMLDIPTLEDLGFKKYKIKNGIHHYTHNDTFLNIEIHLEENYYKCYGCITNEPHQAIMLKMEELKNG
ncbi:MAG: hypothetical protein R3Y05_01505 [bacterium]